MLFAAAQKEVTRQLEIKTKQQEFGLVGTPVPGTPLVQKFHRLPLATLDAPDVKPADLMSTPSEKVLPLESDSEAESEFYMSSDEDSEEAPCGMTSSSVMSVLSCGFFE